MDPNALCQNCGQPLTVQAVGGRCLKCLAALAFGPEELSPSPEECDEQASAPSQPYPRLRYFGDYELIEEIARGGMGVVFKARQLSLDRIVALKMLLAGPFTQKGSIERFRTEARAAANLQHPNIVAIHEIAEHEGQPYFSMDYVEGGHLGDLAHTEPLPARRAAFLLQTIAQAVHFAHDHGVLHRDLKPSNILIDKLGQPRITDFGLAKQLTPNSEIQIQESEPLDACSSSETQHSKLKNQNSKIELTLSGQMLGTPHYMSPEQARGRRGDITAATDIYALGAILFQLLAGRPPFVADSFEGVLVQLQQDEPVAPKLLNPSIPRDLQTICLKCLEKEPRKRYATAQALADELGRFLQDEPIQARPVSAPERVWRWCRRHPLVSGLALALNVALVLGLGGILWQWRRAEQHVRLETAQRMRAQEAVTSLELQRAEYLLDKDEIVMGMAYLSRIVREQPTNHVAARRLLGALAQRNFALPIGPPLQHDKKVCYAEFSPDGQRVATASLDFAARVWDAHTGEALTGPMRHPSAVRMVRISPDGARLVTVTDGFQAHLWDTSTGRVLGQPMTHAKNIRRAWFSPDGRRVLTVSEDATARLWDAQTGQAALLPWTHQGAVRWAAFSPDGQRVATASADQTAQIWNAETGSPAGPPMRHDLGVELVEFSPNGGTVVTAAKDFSTWLWDSNSGEPLGKIVHAAPIASVSFNPDGQHILVALNTGSTRVFNARDWSLVSGPMEHRSGTRGAAFGPEGQRVLTGSLDHTARLWDASNGKALTAPMQHHGMVWWADLGPDGLSVVTASADSTARLWDVRPGETRSAWLRHAGPVRVAQWSQDGARVVTAGDDRSARLWNASTGLPLGTALEHTNVVWVAQISPDGLSVATGSHDGTGRIWDTRTSLPMVEPLRHEGSVRALNFSPDGQWLATSSSDGVIRLWDARTGQAKGEPIRMRDAYVTCLRFSPDSQHLLSSDYKDDMVELREVATGRLLAQSPAREGAVFDADFSPNGRSVATASDDGQVWIWDAQTLRPRLGPLLHLDSVNWVRFSPNGQQMVTASEDATAQVWNVHTGKPAGDPMRHLGPVYTAEFSPDGSMVLTASADGTARLWDAATGRPVAEPFLHRGKVYSAQFSPDGRRVITASHDGGAYVWDVPPATSDASPAPSLKNHRPDLATHQSATPSKAPSSLLALVGDDAGAGSAGALQNAGAPFQHPGLLLADLAEAVLGKRVNAQGALENVPPGGLGLVRQRIEDLPLDTDFARWLHWFCADRSTRMISPYSEIRLPDYIAARAQETNEVSWREALMLDPTNGLAFAQMALHYLRQEPKPGSAEAAQAEWAGGQAVRFAPMRPEPWQSFVQAMEVTGGWARLLKEAERAMEVQPSNPHALHAKARALKELGEQRE